MFNSYQGITLSTTQKRNSLKAMLDALTSRTDIINDRYKKDILYGLLRYMDSINKRFFFQTIISQEINAAFQMAEILEHSNMTGNFYTAVACNVVYIRAFPNQGDLDSSDFSAAIGVAVHQYYVSLAVPKINDYLNAGLNLLVPCFLALWFVPSYNPLFTMLYGGLVLGLALLISALSMPYIPEFTHLDNIFARNPQMQVLLENVAHSAQYSIKVINTGLNRVNRRLTMQDG